MAALKTGARVRYRTPKGQQEGVGKIVDVIETERGLWFEVKDSKTGATVRLRASGLERA